MTQQLPVSRLINAGVVLTPAGAQSQSLSDLLMLGVSSVIDPVERYRTYYTLTAVADDFGTSAPEYKAAVRWFAQTPQPQRLLIGRWFNAASGGGLRGAPLTPAQQALSAWTSITDGSFSFIDGAAVTHDYSALNFSGVTNMNGVASVIQTALGADFTIVWNATLSRFELNVVATGDTTTINLLIPNGVLGTDISTKLKGDAGSPGAYHFMGMAVETAVEAVQLFDDTIGQSWYAVTLALANPSTLDHSGYVDVANFIEATNNKHIFGITTQETDTLVPGNTTNLAYVLKGAAFYRTLIQYSGSDAHAMVSALARIMTTDYSGSNTVITLKFKQEPGVTSETLAASQVNAIEAANCNVFVAYNNDTSIFEPGIMCSGDFVDVILGIDWLSLTIQTQLYNLLYTSTTKIPQTDQGQQLLLTNCEAVCSQAVVNGLLAPGIWNAGGFGQLSQGDYLNKGYYCYSASFNTQAPNDRAARHAMPIQIATKLAGAIHDVRVTVNVNQ